MYEQHNIAPNVQAMIDEEKNRVNCINQEKIFGKKFIEKMRKIVGLYLNNKDTMDIQKQSQQFNSELKKIDNIAVFLEVLLFQSIIEN